jgi:MFS family permease
LKFNSIYFFLGSTAAKKGILIGVVLISVNQLSGLFTFLIYTAEIFIDAGSSFDPNTSAVIVGSLLFLGSLVSLSIVEKFSRRFLYSITTVLYLIGLAAIGLSSYYKANHGNMESLKYIPVISLSLIIFAASCGRLPLTYIMMAEIIPASVRSFGVSICTTFNWILAFVLLRLFAKAVEIIQFHNCMLIFFFFTLFGLFFVIIFVPESKNRSFEEIEKSLSDKKYKYTAARGDEMKTLK